MQGFQYFSNLPVLHYLQAVLFYAPATKSGGGILSYPCPSVCLDIDTWFVRLSPPTVLIFCRMFIHIMEVCMSTGFLFTSNILKMTSSWTFSHFFRTSCIKGTWFVWPTPPSVRITALIFCRMFIHIMEVTQVCMSTGF